MMGPDDKHFVGGIDKHSDMSGTLSGDLPPILVWGSELSPHWLDDDLTFSIYTLCLGLSVDSCLARKQKKKKSHTLEQDNFRCLSFDTHTHWEERGPASIYLKLSEDRVGGFM